MTISLIFCDLQPALNQPQSGVGANGALRGSSIEISGRGAHLPHGLDAGRKALDRVPQPFGRPEVQLTSTRAQQGTNGALLDQRVGKQKSSPSGSTSALPTSPSQTWWERR